MPISKYFKGSGEKVMKNMMKEYGKKKGKSVFYATAQKKGMMGSGVFSKAEQDKGYKVMASAVEICQEDIQKNQMYPEPETNKISGRKMRH